MGEAALKTRYKDNYATPAVSDDENQLTIIALSDNGPMDAFYSFVGMSGLENAETLFGTSGRLPRAIREAIEVSVQRESPITVNAMRCGDGGAKSSLSLLSGGSVALMKIEAAYKGTEGNDWSAAASIDGSVMSVYLCKTESGAASVFIGDNVSDIVDAINASSLAVTASLIIEGALAVITWTDFTGGLSGTLPSKEVIRALDIAEDTEYPNILFCGVNEVSGISIVNTHCASQLSDRQVERYAAVELADFDSTNEENSAAWIVDIETYVLGIETTFDNIDWKNIAPFSGQAMFLDSAGEEYEANIAAACMGAWLGNAVHRSMINQRVPTVQSLVPKFPPSYRDRLTAARMNYIRYQKGRGWIIGNSNTFAASTSDFTDAETLRAIYTCGSEARESAMPVWGTPDDPIEHSGLSTLKTYMGKPLDKRVGKTIVDYEIEPTIDDDTGEVTARMGVRPYNTMKTIDHVVYRKRS